MNLKTKWHLNKVTEGFFLLPLSFTALLLVIAAIRTYKFYVYGLELYPQFLGPKTIHLKDVLQTFWSTSLSPLFFWIPFTLPIDLFIRRTVFRLHE